MNSKSFDIYSGIFVSVLQFYQKLNEAGIIYHIFRPCVKNFSKAAAQPQTEKTRYVTFSADTPQYHITTPASTSS